MAKKNANDVSDITLKVSEPVIAPDMPVTVQNEPVIAPDMPVTVQNFAPIKFRHNIKEMVYGMGNGIDHIQFSNGLFIAQDEVQYDFLINHVDFNRSLFKV
jgi:hypothetical protein